MPTLNLNDVFDEAMKDSSLDGREFEWARETMALMQAERDVMINAIVTMEKFNDRDILRYRRKSQLGREMTAVCWRSSCSGRTLDEELEFESEQERAAYLLRFVPAIRAGPQDGPASRLAPQFHPLPQVVPAKRHQERLTDMVKLAPKQDVHFHGTGYTKTTAKRLARSAELWGFK